METKKPSIDSDGLIILIYYFNTNINQFRLSRDDDNDVVLENSVSFLKYCVTNVEFIFKLTNILRNNFSEKIHQFIGNRLIIEFLNKFKTLISTAFSFRFAVPEKFYF